MSFPVIQVAHAVSTDAYRANPTDTSLVQPALELLKKTDGSIAIYHGLQEEEAKHAYVYILWDHIDSHHKFLADEVKYPILKENITAFFATKAEVFHIQPRGDPLFAFKAPITELVKGTVKDLKDKAELEEILAAMSSTTGIEGHHGTIWGSVVEEDGSYVLLAGWDSVQAHINARGNLSPTSKVSRDRLRELVNFNVNGITHAALHPYV